jgi:hypothetical protein
MSVLGVLKQECENERKYLMISLISYITLLGPSSLQPSFVIGVLQLDYAQFYTCEPVYVGK